MPEQNKSGFAKLNDLSKDEVKNAIASYSVLPRGYSIGGRDKWKNIESYTTIKDSFTRQDYEEYRPEEAVATTQKSIIRQCMEAYRHVGLLRNIIDLMGDFASQGITLVHPNPNIQKFYRDWFSKVDGPERSERFLNMLYRSGNVIIKRSEAKITRKVKNDLKVYAREETTKPEQRFEIKKNVIPWRYVFLSPLMVDDLSGQLGRFVGKSIYALKVPHFISMLVNDSMTTNNEQQKIIDMLPPDIKKALKGGQTHILLDQDNIIVKFYKKDDWQVWADPMTYAIMDDLIQLEKLRLADLSALDTVISQVRLWKLGDLDHELFPTDVAVNKLTDILSSNPGAGAFDIIWGPELSFQESSTEAHKFLGPQKYEPTLNNIYAGLGVPPTLTGSSSSGGFTNNFISLQTLIKRLEYGRSILTEFWNDEILRVQKAMDFRLPARVRYNRMILNDEAAEKDLLIKMWERNLITDATILERFGEDPQIEQLLSKKENQEREKGQRQVKTSPYHIEDKDFELKKIALGRGYLKPSQTGLDVQESYKEEPFIIQSKNKTGNKLPDTPSIKDKGRPFNSRDKKPRDRTVKPRVSAEKIIWAKKTQDRISKVLTPLILQSFEKKSVRDLSQEQYSVYETIKFAVLANLDPLQHVDDNTFIELIKNGVRLSNDFKNLYSKYLTDDMGIEERRMLQTVVYAELK